MPLAPSDAERQRLAAPLGSQMHLGGAAAAAAPERLVFLTADRAGRMMVRADHRPVHEVGAPVKPSREVGDALEEGALVRSTHRIALRTMR